MDSKSIGIFPHEFESLVSSRRSLVGERVAAWSSGMIPALGAGGPGFNSRSGPIFINQIVENLDFCKIEFKNFNLKID